MIWCAECDMELNINIGLKVSMFSLHTQISSLQYALVFLEAMGPGAVLAVGGVPQCPSKSLYIKYNSTLWMLLMLTLLMLLMFLMLLMALMLLMLLMVLMLLMLLLMVFNLMNWGKLQFLFDKNSILYTGYLLMRRG